MMVTLERRSVLATAAVWGLVGAGGAEAQTLAERVDAVFDGTIRMTFAARPGVCGNGQNIRTGSDDNPDWDWECESGPVRVVLSKVDGTIIRVRTYVGGRWRTASRTTDLGHVSSAEAAEYLTRLAEHGNGRASRDAIMPATLADSAVVWPALLRVARSETRPRRTRRNAAQWVGMAAGRAVTGRNGAAEIDDPDRKAREQAVFAVSQLPKDQGIPLLLDVARTNRDPAIRSRALFWLGQSGDPRAFDLFEEVLRAR